MKSSKLALIKNTVTKLKNLQKIKGGETGNQTVQRPKCGDGSRVWNKQ